MSVDPGSAETVRPPKNVIDAIRSIERVEILVSEDDRLASEHATETEMPLALYHDNMVILYTEACLGHDAIPADIDVGQLQRSSTSQEQQRRRGRFPDLRTMEVEDPAQFLLFGECEPYIQFLQRIFDVDAEELSELELPDHLTLTDLCRYVFWFAYHYDGFTGGDFYNSPMGKIRYPLNRSMDLRKPDQIVEDLRRILGYPLNLKISRNELMLLHHHYMAMLAQAPAENLLRGAFLYLYYLVSVSYALGTLAKEEDMST